MDNKIENIKNLLPKNKFDNTNLYNITKLSEDEFLIIADELLTWLQDVNWPIFNDVLAVLIYRQNEIINKVKNIFKTNNFIWQYWILLFLYPKLNTENKNKLNEELNNIAQKSPSENEDEQEVIKLAKEIVGV